VYFLNREKGGGVFLKLSHCTSWPYLAIMFQQLSKEMLYFVRAFHFFSPREAQQCRSKHTRSFKANLECHRNEENLWNIRLLSNTYGKFCCLHFEGEKPDQRIRQKVWSSRNKDWAKTTIKHDEVQVAVLFMILILSWNNPITTLTQGKFLGHLRFIFAHTIPNLTPASKQFVISHHSPMITLQTHFANLN